MKKIIFISMLAAAAVAAISCTKEQATSATSRVPATINAVSASSAKMTIDALQTSWEVGDAITVFEETGMPEGTFTATASGVKVAFSGTKASEEDNLFYALFPADENAEYDFDNNGITTTIPWEQDGSISNAVAVAQKDVLGNFAFVNATSVIKFTIPESETDILSVSFVADSLKTIAGDVIVGTDGTISLATAGDAKKYSTVMIRNSDKTPLTPGVKYMTVIPGKYTGTLIFAKKDGATRYAAAKPVSVRTYSANTIKNFGTAKLTWIKGAVNGVFTANISPSQKLDKKVLLAQGNIQYNPSANTWRISTDLKGTLAYDPDNDWVEYFYFCNANDPLGHQDYSGQLAWTTAGDWSKKLDQEGWSIWNQVEANFMSPMDGTNNNREKFGVVTQSNGTCKDADGMYYVVLYPDGYPGEVLAKDGYNTVVKTADYLNELEDLGCAIFACNGNYDWNAGSGKGNKAVTSTKKVGDYWTATPKTNNAQANSLRFIYTKATPEIKTSGVWDAACNVRPMYEIK